MVVRFWGQALNAKTAKSKPKAVNMKHQHMWQEKMKWHKQQMGDLEHMWELYNVHQCEAWLEYDMQKRIGADLLNLGLLSRDCSLG